MFDFTNMKYQLHHGDCLEVLSTMPDNSVDSIVTDPPYGLSFMGKKWDYDVPSEDIWRECLRVLKPGGHLLAFAGTRTQHRMAVRIEDAGFEIRDMIAWVYASGFPKSLNVSKAIDKAAGTERDVVGVREDFAKRASKIRVGVSWADPELHDGSFSNPQNAGQITAPATEAAKQWQGWGTALKPALEPITVARKPLGEKTVAENVLAHGTGGINVDGCRVEGIVTTNPLVRNVGGFQSNGLANQSNPPASNISQGRWPANLIHDGSDEVQGLFPQTGASKSTPRNNGEFKSVAKGRDLPHVTHGHDDNGGSAARFFYCAKTSKTDRNEGLEDAPDAVLARSCQAIAEAKRGNTVESEGGAFNKARVVKNNHPTVKPTALMRYLCRLVTPPEGIVLDPFMGSGSTGKAAMLEGFHFIGIERDADYLEIAKARITAS